jgi:molybdopterin synthase catalytic subunit
MIEVTKKAQSPESVIQKVRNDRSGCVVTYVGLIRDSSGGKQVASVEYKDAEGNAAARLQEIADGAQRKWRVEAIAISHRVGKLQVGDINLVIAVASAHRKEGFAACHYLIDEFKAKLPTRKIETYRDDQEPQA